MLPLNFFIRTVTMAKCCSVHFSGLIDGNWKRKSHSRPFRLLNPPHPSYTWPHSHFAFTSTVPPHFLYYFYLFIFLFFFRRSHHFCLFHSMKILPARLFISNGWRAHNFFFYSFSFIRPSSSNSRNRPPSQFLILAKKIVVTFHI